MKKFIKIISVLMFAVLLVTIIPFNVFAGTESINLNENYLFRPYKSFYLEAGNEYDLSFTPQYTAEYTLRVKSKYNIRAWLCDNNNKVLIDQINDENRPDKSSVTMTYTLEEGKTYHYMVAGWIPSTTSTVNITFESKESGTLDNNNPLRIQFSDYSFENAYSHDAMLSKLNVIIYDGKSTLVWSYAEADGYTVIDGVDLIIDTSDCGFIGNNEVKIHYLGYEATGTFDVKDKATTTEPTTTTTTETTTTTTTEPTTTTTTSHVHSYGKWTVTKAATCTATGTETRVCSADGYKETRTIAAKGHTSKTTTTKAKTGADGSIVKKCTVCNKTLSTTVIPKASSINLSATSYTHDGKVKTPTVTVKDSKGKTLKNGTDYTVSNPSGRKNVGKYTVTITLKGNYSGTVKKTFTIKPKATSISKLTATSKGFKVTWKKQATQTTGYQIQYSTSNKFSNAKTVTISKNGTTSRTVSKLTGKKKYFVRVRTYRTVSGTKIYSSWSGSKSVTTKK